MWLVSRRIPEHPCTFPKVSSLKCVLQIQSSTPVREFVVAPECCECCCCTNPGCVCCSLYEQCTHDLSLKVKRSGKELSFGVYFGPLDPAHRVAYGGGGLPSKKKCWERFSQQGTLLLYPSFFLEILVSKLPMNQRLGFCLSHLISGAVCTKVILNSLKRTRLTD